MILAWRHVFRANERGSCHCMVDTNEKSTRDIFLCKEREADRKRIWSKLSIRHRFEKHRSEEALSGVGSCWRDWIYKSSKQNLLSHTSRNNNLRTTCQLLLIQSDLWLLTRPLNLSEPCGNRWIQNCLLGLSPPWVPYMKVREKKAKTGAL